MIDALTWFGKDDMRLLVIRTLDPTENLGIEAELNFDNWPPRRLATQLEAQIRAHGLVETAIAGMLAIQQTGPDLNRLAGALRVVAPGQPAPGDAVPVAIQTAIIGFSSIFADRRPKFTRLGQYKELHDHLHILQGMEVGIDQAGTRFFNGPSETKEMVALSKDLLDLAAKARRNLESLNRPRRVNRWVEAFERAAGAMLKAAETHDASNIANLTVDLRRIPSQNLADLNIDLLECVEGLGLEELAHRMSAILADLAAVVAGSEFVAALQLSLNEFKVSCIRLRKLIADHDACQSFETVVALAADNDGKLLPASIVGWAEARDAMAAVVPVPNDCRAANAAAAAIRFEAAAIARNGTDAVAELSNLLGLFRPLFKDIDSMLLDLTDHLVQMAAYLDVQLRNSAHVN